jgi:hypothetical protein
LPNLFARATHGREEHRQDGEGSDPVGGKGEGLQEDFRCCRPTARRLDLLGGEALALKA